MTGPGAPNLRSFGLGACVLLVYLMGCAAGISVSDEGLTVAWLNKWQTLVGAFVALIAAFIGAWFLNRQIGVAREIEREKRLRKRMAARSVTPIALSALVEYCLHCGDRLHILHGLVVKDGFIWSGLVTKDFFPAIPPDVITTFKEFIEHCEPEEAHSFRDIIASMQVLNANLRDLQQPRGIKASLSRHSDRRPACTWRVAVRLCPVRP